MDNIENMCDLRVAEDSDLKLWLENGAEIAFIDFGWKYYSLEEKLTEKPKGWKPWHELNRQQEKKRWKNQR